MDLEKQKLLEQLEELSGSKFAQVFKEPLERFTYYFSKLDIEGIKNILSDDCRHGGYPKVDYLELIEDAFNYLKSEGILSLEAHSGACAGCFNGCKGFTFIDDKKGYYIDIVIENNEKEFRCLKECYGLKNNNNNLNKKQRVIMDPLFSCNLSLKSSE